MFHCSVQFGGFELDAYAFAKRTSTNRGDIAIGQAIREQLTRRGAPEFLDLMWGDLSAATVDRINREADLFVICGGGYIFLDTDGSLNRRLDDVAWFERIRCPKAGYAIGLNRLLHEAPYDPAQPLPDETVDRVRRLSEQCRFLSVRDAGTARLIARCTGRQPEVTGDAALFLEPADIAAPTLRDHARDRLAIGLNFAVHGPLAVRMVKRLLPAALPALRQIELRHRPRWVYLQHSDEEAAVIRWLRARGFRFEVVDGSPRQLLAGYGGLDLVICQMLHSCILAANAGVPMVNIAYDLKNVAFFELMGLPEQCLPHDAAGRERLVDLVDRTVARRTELSARIGRRKAELAAATDRFANQLMAIAETPQAAAV